MLEFGRYSKHNLENHPVTSIDIQDHPRSSKVVYVNETPVEDVKLIRRELKLMYHPHGTFDDRHRPELTMDFDSIKWIEDHIPETVDLSLCRVMKWSHVGSGRDEEWLLLLPDGKCGFLGLDRQLGFALFTLFSFLFGTGFAVS